MKRYIKSASGHAFGKEWTRNDIEVYNTVDWRARNYEDYPVDGDTIMAEIRIYGLPGYKMPITAPVRMQKFLRANPIFSPYYAPVNDDIVLKFIPDEYKDIPIVGPMSDGRTHNGNLIMDRYETQEIYDAMMR